MPFAYPKAIAEEQKRWGVVDPLLIMWVLIGIAVMYYFDIRDVLAFDTRLYRYRPANSECNCTAVFRLNIASIRRHNARRGGNASECNIVTRDGSERE